MKAYIRDYIKFAKSGLFKNSYYYFVVFFILMIVIAPHIGGDVEIITWMFFAMLVLEDLNGKKYVIATSLPIAINERIRLFYVNTYVLCFLSMLAGYLGYLIIGRERSIATSIVIFCLTNIGAHLYYAIFCSQEFKEDPQERTKAMMIFVGILTILAMGLVVIHHYLFKGGLIHYAMTHISISSKVIVIVIVGILQGVTAQLSFKKVERVARNREVRA